MASSFLTPKEESVDNFTFKLVGFLVLAWWLLIFKLFSSCVPITSILHHIGISYHTYGNGMFTHL